MHNAADLLREDGDKPQLKNLRLYRTALPKVGARKLWLRRFNAVNVRILLTGSPTWRYERLPSEADRSQATDSTTPTMGQECEFAKHEPDVRPFDAAIVGNPPRCRCRTQPAPTSAPMNCHRLCQIQRRLSKCYRRSNVQLRLPVNVASWPIAVRRGRQKLLNVVRCLPLSAAL